MKLGGVVVVAVCVVSVLATDAAGRKFRIGKQSKQAVLVVTDSWTATAGKLSRWERGASGPWKRVGEPIDVVVGKSGLGWGLGLHADDVGMDRLGPLKAERDGRAPAGVFRFGEATGYAATAPEGTTLAYRPATDKLRCVDDPKSPLYNQLVEETAEKRWTSAEAMRRTDEEYALTIGVEHNKKPIVAGQGSCIFLHAWATPATPTVGCTAMAPADLATLLGWLKADAQPLLVQLPKKEYETLTDEWKLPRTP